MAGAGDVVCFISRGERRLVGCLHVRESVVLSGRGKGGGGGVECLQRSGEGTYRRGGC